MSKHVGKRFQGNSKSTSSKSCFKIIKKLIFILLLALLILFLLAHWHRLPQPSAENVAAPVAETAEPESSTSNFSPKKLEETHLMLQNLSIQYDQSISTIRFDLSNDSDVDQSAVAFSFSLLDENQNVIIHYDKLSTKETIEAHQKKNFMLIATRDVSHASDYKIETIK